MRTSSNILKNRIRIRYSDWTSGRNGGRGGVLKILERSRNILGEVLDSSQKSLAGDCVTEKLRFCCVFVCR